MLSKQILIGLPEAGKSTFLAALRHIVDVGRVPGSLRLAHVHGDQQYLNEIRDAWGNCQRIERNRRGQGRMVSLMLLSPDETGEVELVLPDPAGESFSDQWELGRCPLDYTDLVREATGVLLFVNPERVNEGLSISQVTQAADAAGADRGACAPTPAPKPWAPESAGTQVQLVEMLQVLLRAPFERKRLPLAVIVSAWDRLLELGSGPEEWLAEALPLLYQYLLANSGTFPSRIYGISAQGGDISTQRSELLDKVEWKRVIVVGPECGPHDITAPIRWLMGASGMAR